jgi:hypothetical protein
MEEWSKNSTIFELEVEASFLLHACEVLLLGNYPLEQILQEAE